MNKIRTGYLNYFCRLDIVKIFLNTHPDLKNEILKFKPTQKTRKSFMTAYKKFLKHIDKLDLTKFGFIANTISSDYFGTKTFYNSPAKEYGWDSWAEVFEAIHLKLI